MLNREPFLCASALPELHVPFTSQSHNLESQPFDELHEFVTGLSVIKLSPFQLLLSFFSSSFQLLLEQWGDWPPTSGTLEPSWCGTWCAAACGTSRPKIKPWRVQMGASRINIKEGKIGGRYRPPRAPWGWKKKVEKHCRFKITIAATPQGQTLISSKIRIHLISQNNTEYSVIITLSRKKRPCETLRPDEQGHRGLKTHVNMPSAHASLTS